MACGTNWAITPATGVPWPPTPFLRTLVPPPPPPVPPVVEDAVVVAARSWLPRPPVNRSVPGATRPRNGGDEASTPVSTTATALF